MLSERLTKNFKTLSYLGAFFLLSLGATGCATYQGKVREARDHLERGEANKAAELLEPLAKKPGDDQLVYLFDYATALQVAGKFSESNQQLQAADHMSEQKDYLSLSRLGGSLLMSEEFTQYKGDDYERLLTNVMSALNYLMIGDHENALVEIRRLNQKLEYYRIEEKKEYEQNTAALYLSALMWEADKNWDSAYIDFERAYKRDPTIGYIRGDLVRAARRASRADTADKWMREFKIKPKPEWTDKSLGEVVLIYQQGWGPRKAERPRVATATGFISPGFPMLVPVPSITKRAQLEILKNVGASAEAQAESIIAQTESQFIYSVEQTAIKTLEQAYAPLIAKRIAAYAAKEVVAAQVDKKNEALGAIMRIAMHVADRADLRQWSTLPETIQVAKLYLKPGRYIVRVRGLSSAGSPTGEDMAPIEIEVKAQTKTFLSWRSFR